MVNATLVALNTPVAVLDAKPVVAVTLRASVKPDHLISMIDGKPHRMLRRHIGYLGYTSKSWRAAFDAETPGTVDT